MTEKSASETNRPSAAQPYWMIYIAALLGGIILLAAAWLVTTLVARFAVARIGGLTGDIYGATCEVTETILLLVALPTVSGFIPI